MSQKRKRGLQRGLSEIGERQTAPVIAKSQLSRGLIDKFADPKEPISTPTTHGTQGTKGSQPMSVAPMRDFMKVANSISRQAIPAGLFKGKAKQIYDFLYSKTRRAIVPARTVQLSRREIMAGAYVGSDKTLRENLLHLRGVGLVVWDEQLGVHAGNIYTVFLPEEAATPVTLGSQSTQGSYGQNLPTVPRVESTQGTEGLSVDSKIGSAGAKTSFKTKDINTDDEHPLVKLLKQAEKELTGKNNAQVEKWTELAIYSLLN